MEPHLLIDSEPIDAQLIQEIIPAYGLEEADGGVWFRYRDLRFLFGRDVVLFAAMRRDAEMSIRTVVRDRRPVVEMDETFFKACVDLHNEMLEAEQRLKDMVDKAGCEEREG